MNSAMTIGVLSPGELGSALGRLLAGPGRRVVTTTAGRSLRTQRLCAEAGLEVLPSLADVAEVAEVVLSTVPPAAALGTAEAYAACVRPGPVERLYVDLNSIAPTTAIRIAEVLAAVGVTTVDGSVFGLAPQLESRGVLYLSGAAADRVAPLFAGRVRIQIIGREVGQASAQKMLLSVVSKGLPAMFLELGQAARAAGLLEEVSGALRDFYPGVMTIIDRLLPTYPLHAARRAEELHDVEETLRTLGITPHVTAGVRQVIQDLAALNLASLDRSWTVAEVVEAAHTRTVS